MPYTYNRAKNAGYDGWDPPESYFDDHYPDQEWDSAKVENGIEAAVKQDLGFAAKELEKESNGEFRLKVKSVSAAEGDTDLDTEEKEYEARWTWNIKWGIYVDLEILGPTKLMSAEEIYDMLYGNRGSGDYGDSVEEDGVFVEIPFDPDPRSAKWDIRYYGNKLKVHIRTETTGYVSGRTSWEPNWDPPEPDYY